MTALETNMPPEDTCNVPDAAAADYAQYARDPNARLNLLLELINAAGLIEAIATCLLARELEGTPAQFASAPRIEA